jgi:hypothetical protein
MPLELATMGSDDIACRRAPNEDHSIRLKKAMFGYFEHL